MAWRKPSVRQTKLAHKSADHFRAISPALAELIRRQRREQRPRLRLGSEFQKPSFDKGRMQRNNALRPARLQRASFRIQFHAPDIVDLDDVLRPQLANLGNPRPRVGPDPRYPLPNRILFS